MSSPGRSLDVAAVAVGPATTPRVQVRQDLYRDAVRMVGSVSYFVSCDLAHNALPPEIGGSRARGFNFLCCAPPNVDWESTAGRSSRRRRFRLLGYPHQVRLGIAGPGPIDLALAEDLVE